jgi:hypothetical protein
MQIVRISARMAAKSAAIWRTVFYDAQKTKASMTYINSQNRLQYKTENAYIVKTTYGKMSVFETNFNVVHGASVDKTVGSTAQALPFFKNTIHHSRQQTLPQLIHIWSLNDAKSIERAMCILKQYLQTSNTVINADYGNVPCHNQHLAGINCPTVSPIDLLPASAN